MQQARALLYPGYLITQPTISCVTERAADDAAAVYNARLLRADVSPAYYPPNIYSLAGGIDQWLLTLQATSKHSNLRSKVTDNCVRERSSSAGRRTYVTVSTHRQLVS